MTGAGSDPNVIVVFGPCGHPQAVMGEGHQSDGDVNSWIRDFGHVKVMLASEFRALIAEIPFLCSCPNKHRRV